MTSIKKTIGYSIISALCLFAIGIVIWLYYQIFIDAGDWLEFIKLLGIGTAIIVIAMIIILGFIGLIVWLIDDRK